MPLPTIPSGNVNSGLATGYDVANSVRFNDGDSAYMHITRGSAGNQRTFTISMWIKRCELGSSNYFFTVGPDGDTNFVMYFDSNDQLEVWEYKSSYQFRLKPKYKFRDIVGWYHLCVAVDTTQSTSTNRVKIYVNGTQLTDFDTSSYPSQDYDTLMNDDRKYWLGKYTSLSFYYDGYLAEVLVLDGTAATPTSFGEYDEDTPTIWKPINVSGLTFGTNGFYLDFEDSSNLGNDANGGTDWTEVNLDATDQSTDTCTNNFATLNPLAPYSNTTYSEGNCIASGSANAWQLATGTIGVSQGKWYWEVLLSGGTAGNYHTGVRDESANDYTGNHNQNGTTTFYNGDGGEVFKGGVDVFTTANYGTMNASSDILGVALNMDDKQITLYKNGSAIASNVALSTSISEAMPTFLTDANDVVFKVNFGGCPSFAISSGNADGNGYGNFEYSVPSNYYSLCTKNLAEFG